MLAGGKGKSNSSKILVMLIKFQTELLVTFPDQWKQHGRVHPLASIDALATLLGTSVYLSLPVPAAAAQVDEGLRTARIAAATDAAALCRSDEILASLARLSTHAGMPMVENICWHMVEATSEAEHHAGPHGGAASSGLNVPAPVLSIGRFEVLSKRTHLAYNLL